MHEFEPGGSANTWRVHRGIRSRLPAYRLSVERVGDPPSAPRTYGSSFVPPKSDEDAGANPDGLAERGISDRCRDATERAESRSGSESTENPMVFRGTVMAHLLPQNRTRWHVSPHV